MTTFLEAMADWQRRKQEYLLANMPKIEKQQLNVYVPSAIADSIKEYVSTKRTEFEAEHLRSNKRRLALKFEDANKTPHSKDY